MRILRQEAEQGNAGSQFGLGYEYFGRKNYTEAMKWYRISAGNGYKIAFRNIASMYKDGRGVEKDDIEATRWYLKALENGEFSFSWFETPRGKAAAAVVVAEYRNAAEQGDANAQLKFGRLYVNGWGVAENYPEAIAWYRKAAEQGNAEGQFRVATILIGSTLYGGPKIQNRNADYAEALEWFYKAAAQGHAQAQAYIGLIYHWGIHAIKDDIEAAAWYYLARNNGAADVSWFNVLDGMLNTSGRQQAQQRAKELAAKIAAGEPLK